MSLHDPCCVCGSTETRLKSVCHAGRLYCIPCGQAAYAAQEAAGRAIVVHDAETDGRKIALRGGALIAPETLCNIIERDGAEGER